MTSGRPGRRRPAPLPPARQRALARLRAGPRRSPWGPVLAVVEAGLVAWLATGLVGRSVRPEAWGWPQVAALGLPVVAVLAVPAGGLLAAAAVRRGRSGRRAAPLWGALALHAGLAAAAWARLGLPGAPAAPALETAPSDVLRVTTLNAGGASYASPLLFAETLEAEAPHLVAVQEANVLSLHVPDPGVPDARVWAQPPVLSPLVRSGAYRLPEVGPSVEDQQTLWLPVFGRVPVRPPRFHLLGADEGAGRYTRTEFEWAGRTAALYNVHLRSFGEERPWAPGQAGGLAAWREAGTAFLASVRLRSAEADHLREALGAERLPFLVVGDLNSTPHQWAYARVAGGLTDAVAAAGGGWSASYPDRRPLVRIDVVLASPEWTVEAAWTGPRGLSDHRAVSAWLRLRPGAGP